MNADHKLKTAVLDELAWEPSVDADHIGVTAEDGVVTLTGHVTSFWEKTAAEKATRRVKGLRAMAEEIEVRLPSDARYSDSEIAKAAIHRLDWDASIPKNAIKVKVENGFVTLTGEVGQNYQHDEAARSIRSLSGVVAISNQITVKPQLNTSKIKDDIRQALHRTWYAHDHVHVTAKDGIVHLTGNVASWQDRRMAETTAWRASGTTSVVNDIQID